MEGVKGRDFENKVKVEDYRPEDKRAHKDQEFTRRAEGIPEVSAEQPDNIAVEDV